MIFNSQALELAIALNSKVASATVGELISGSWFERPPIKADQVHHFEDDSIHGFDNANFGPRVNKDQILDGIRLYFENGHALDEGEKSPPYLWTEVENETTRIYEALKIIGLDSRNTAYAVWKALKGYA